MIGIIGYSPSKHYARSHVRPDSFCPSSYILKKLSPCLPLVFQFVTHLPPADVPLCPSATLPYLRLSSNQVIVYLSFVSRLIPYSRLVWGDASHLSLPVPFLTRKGEDHTFEKLYATEWKGTGVTDHIVVSPVCMPETQVMQQVFCSGFWVVGD